MLRRAFGGTAPVSAHETHENARVRLSTQPDSTLPPSDVTFADRLVLPSRTRPAELRYLGRNHSDDMLVVYLPREKITFAVDFAGNDRVAYRDMAGVFLPDMFDSTRRLQRLDHTRVVFGHGPPGDRAAVDRQLRYFGDLRAAVAAALARGVFDEEAARTVRLPQYEGWGGYAEWFPLNERGVCRWLASDRRAP